MKITNEKILTAAVYSQSISAKQFPPRAAYTIGWNFDKIDSALKIYDQTRNKQMERYVEKDENGKIETQEDGKTVVFKSGEAKEKWSEEVKELNEIEADINIRKLKIEDFGDAKFSVAELRAIDFMIEE